MHGHSHTGPPLSSPQPGSALRVSTQILIPLSFVRMDPHAHRTYQMYGSQHGRRPLCAGVAPGQFHDIIRAETFGVLVCLEHTWTCHTHCDNQGVVNMLQGVLKTPFDPLTFRAQPNYDLSLRFSTSCGHDLLTLSKFSKSRLTEHFRTLQTSKRSGWRWEMTRQMHLQSKPYKTAFKSYARPIQGGVQCQRDS